MLASTVVAASSASDSVSMPASPSGHSGAFGQVSDEEESNGGTDCYQPSPASAPVATDGSSESRQTPSARGRQLATRSGTGGNEVLSARRPLVVSTSKASLGQVRRAGIEDTQLTKAALRCAKNPGDAQALGRLQSLLGHNGSSSSSAANGNRSMRGSSSTGQLVGTEPVTNSVQQQIQHQPVKQALAQQPRTTSPCAAHMFRFPDRTSSSEFESPMARARGPVSAVPMWASARMTWPSPEQRAQMLTASSSGGTRSSGLSLSHLQGQGPASSRRA